MKILLLEDDITLCETLQLFLQREGYDVDIVLDIHEAEELSFTQRYDLYLLDINLPEGSGLSFLKSLRNAQDNTPTIFITAQIDLDSMAQGFELDAIDYIKKPFDPEELLIRLYAKFKPTVIHYGDIEYDTKSGIVRQDGEVIDLGNVHHQIFTMLLLHCGAMVPKEELYECFEHSSSRALRVAISMIKQKLGIEIKNIRAKGYLLENL